MKKFVKWGVLALVLLLVVGVTVVYFRLNTIVKSAVETQGSKQMNLKTELKGASVSLFGGQVGFDDLKIANPPGFAAPHLFTLEGLDMKVPIRQLRDNPKRVSNITLDKPKLVIERSADGKFNFRQAIEQMPQSTSPKDPQQPADGEEMKLIIDDLTIKEATVVVRPGIDLPGVAKEYTLPLPTVSLKNIGNSDNAQNGAALRDVAQQVITVMAANASNSDLLPEQLRGLLSLDVNSVVAQLGERLGGEVQKRIAAAVPGELGAQLSKAMSDPNALLKDPSKAVDSLKENFGKQLEGKGVPTSNPADVLKDPGKAVEGLKGLLGGGGKKKVSPPDDAPARNQN